MNSSEIFKEKKYTFTPQLLDQDTCKEYTFEFNKLIQQGNAKIDPQCPLSYSLGHCALFDSLLAQLTPHIEERTGLNLYPTYAYARWYHPGDELKIHRDREACEITVTLNLGFEGEQWPIYVGTDEEKQNYEKIDMQVGDAVIFRGQELYHWREKYTEGQWQAQVFLHYVDKNGPHAEWKFDKRTHLSHITDGSFYCVKNAFSSFQCQKLIEQFENNIDKQIPALLTGNRLDTSIRDSKKIQLPVDKGIATTLYGIGMQVNRSYWNFNITHMDQSEYLKYDKQGHFSSHMDTLLEDFNSITTRKITSVLILNDDFEGGRFYIKVGSEKKYPPQKAGDVIFFPSFVIHGVEPVTSGIRRTIVTWLEGPYFK